MKHFHLWFIFLPSLLWALEAPQVSLTSTTDGFYVYSNLTWSAVNNATSYDVYYKSLPYGTTIFLENVTATNYSASVPTGWTWNDQPTVIGFFNVVAKDELSSLIPALISVPSGIFIMGQNGVVTPEHTVTLTHPFLLGETEVTNDQFRGIAQWALDNGYATITNGNLVAYGQLLLDLSSSTSEIIYSDGELIVRMAPGAGAWGFDNTQYNPALHPVKLVSWYGAACFCDWLSIQVGMIPYYEGQWSQIPGNRDPYDATGFRMPTEAEWEYAARYNDQRTYPWGNIEPNCALTNFNMCTAWTSEVNTHQAGGSALGFQDMAGNNAEFVNDRYSDYSSSPLIDPAGPITGSNQVVKGGGWGYSLYGQRCAERLGRAASYTSYGLGFRICRTLN